MLQTFHYDYFRVFPLGILFIPIAYAFENARNKRILEVPPLRPDAISGRELALLFAPFLQIARHHPAGVEHRHRETVGNVRRSDSLQDLAHRPTRPGILSFGTRSGQELTDMPIAHSEPTMLSAQAARLGDPLAQRVSVQRSLRIRAGYTPDPVE